MRAALPLFLLLLALSPDGRAAGSPGSQAPSSVAPPTAAAGGKAHPEPSVSFTDPTLGIPFVRVKGGCYRMGDTFAEGERDEKPDREVCAGDFYLAQYDVTVGDFRRFVRATGYRTEAEEGGGCAALSGQSWEYDAGRNWKAPGYSQDEHHPVACVSWNDARAFIAWLGKVSHRHYRLPTEAEWEYAARSGGKRERFAGFSEEKELQRYANFCDRNCDLPWKSEGQNDHFRHTSPVGSYEPNSLGLYDMTGNVWQWLSDFYEHGYYREGERLNPQGPATGEKRVLRGGAWDSKPHDLRASNRLRSLPLYRFNNAGFRLATSP